MSKCYICEATSVPLVSNLFGKRYCAECRKLSFVAKLPYELVEYVESNLLEWFSEGEKELLSNFKNRMDDGGVSKKQFLYLCSLCYEHDMYLSGYVPDVDTDKDGYFKMVQ